jgi:hypothetical protein
MSARSVINGDSEKVMAKGHTENGQRFVRQKGIYILSCDFRMAFRESFCLEMERQTMLELMTENEGFAFCLALFNKRASPLASDLQTTDAELDEAERHAQQCDYRNANKFWQCLDWPSCSDNSFIPKRAGAYRAAYNQGNQDSYHYGQAL